jgi:hypothetical protein
MPGFAAAWEQYWLHKGVSLDDTPAYPLARTVPMPADVGYETGALSFRMTDLQLQGVDRLAGAEFEPAESRVRVKLTLAQVTLRGRYALEVKPDPIVDIDTAGNLMDLAPDALRPIAGGADGDSGSLDPAKEEWLDQARDQRTRLQSTPQGLKLMEVYGEHNETYDSVFRTNSKLGVLWRADGATGAMAGDTSDALKNDTVVNASDKLYPGNRTYNGNAFVQQLNVASACVWTDPGFDPKKGPPPDSKYWAAAKAALAFGKGVGATTNNSKKQVTPLRPTEIHATIESQDPNKSLPPVADSEMGSIMAMGIKPGGADPASLPDWLVVDEEDQVRLRTLFEATMKQKAEDATITGQLLHEGAVSAEIDQVEAVLELNVEAGAISARCAQIDLPAYAFEIDDSTWAGAVADMARARLDATYFIRSLLHDAIVERLRGSLQDAAAYAYGLHVGLA